MQRCFDYVDDCTIIGLREWALRLGFVSGSVSNLPNSGMRNMRSFKTLKSIVYLPS